MGGSSIKINFLHHLSLKYVGGGEKWVIQTAKELHRRGHDVAVYALPFRLKGSVDSEQPKQLGNVPYHEGFFHNVEGDVNYFTYHPLAQLSFRVKGKAVAGVHSQVYDSALSYGTLPTMAKYVHKLVGDRELRRFDAVHVVNPLTKVSHRRVFSIPNFVDSEVYRPCVKPDEFTVAFASRHVWQKGFDVWSKLKPLLMRFAVVKESGCLSEGLMPKFLGSSHAVFNCSRVDTFGLSSVESLLCGTPVISSGLPAHRCLGTELLYAGSLKDNVRLAESLKDRWFGDREGYFDYARLCRDSALRYDKKRVMDKLEDMFVEVASR